MSDGFGAMPVRSPLYRQRPWLTDTVWVAHESLQLFTRIAGLMPSNGWWRLVDEAGLGVTPADIDRGPDLGAFMAEVHARSTPCVLNLEDYQRTPDRDEAMRRALELSRPHARSHARGSSMTASPVLSHGAWPSNAEMIADARRLGYLTDDGLTWDGTHRLGVFWKAWRPQHLVATDLDPKYSPSNPEGVDACATNFGSETFDHVVLDPPYKLNGTDQGEGHRYGVTGPYKSVEDRLRLMRAMLVEGHRVLRPGGTLLYKCQDQTNAGRKVWQTDLVTGWAAELGLVKIDALQLEAYRPQPARSTCRWCEQKIMRRADGRWGLLKRSDGVDLYACAAYADLPEGLSNVAHQPDPTDIGQDASHANYSTLLVFERPTRSQQTAATLQAPLHHLRELVSIAELTEDRSDAEQAAIAWAWDAINAHDDAIEGDD